MVAALSASADEGGRSNVWSCEIRAPELKLTSCELRNIRHARDGKAVMLNADRGFVRNSRGFAEAAFEAPSEGWYEVTVSGCSNGRTPLEIWVNDYEKVVLPFAAARSGKFVEETFRHRFRAGRNVLRLLGPGSALYIAVDGVKVAGPVAAPTADGTSRPGPDVAALAARIDAKLAAGVTLAKDITYLEPPAVEKPFSVRIDKVTPENEVVYYSGTVSPKKDDVTVEVTYRVTDARGNSALTKPVKVRVKRLREAKSRGRKRAVSVANVYQGRCPWLGCVTPSGYRLNFLADTNKTQPIICVLTRRETRSLSLPEASSCS